MYTIVFEERLDRIAAEIRVHGDGVGVISLEGFVRVLLGGAADVTALGVEDDDGVGRGGLDVVDGVFELRFGAVRGVVRELRLVRAHEIPRGIDDSFVELEDAAGRVAKLLREFLRLRIEAHAHE